MVHLKNMGAKDEPWNKCIAKHGQPVLIRQPCLLKIGLHYAANNYTTFCNRYIYNDKKL